MRVKRDCSMFEYFWNAMFLMTGGSWWWSPIMIQRLSRLKPSSGFCSNRGMKVSISRICAASSIKMLSYLKPKSKDTSILLAQSNGITWPCYHTSIRELMLARSFVHCRFQTSFPTYSGDQKPISTTFQNFHFLFLIYLYFSEVLFQYTAGDCTSGTKIKVNNMSYSSVCKDICEN